MIKHPKEVRWRDLVYSTAILRALGLPAPSLDQLKHAVRRRHPKVLKRKTGPTQGSPTYYRTRRRG